jgi:Sulfotransferase family
VTDAGAAAQAPGPPRVIYLGGLGRSGTTLIERLLAELPGACSVGEIVHMWQRGVAEQERCGCGEPFGQCPFWAQVGQAAFGGWGQLDVSRVSELRGAVDRSRHIPRLAGATLPVGLRRDLDEYTGYYLRLYTAIGQVSGCPVVVDSSKHPSLAFCLRSRPELDLRVIHVVRDSRAVAYSWTKQVARPDSAAPTFMATYSPAAAAGQWNAQNGAVQLLARRGVATLRVRYEDLVAAPEETLTSMARFAGLPVGPPDLRFLGQEAGARFARLRAGHSASGNPMRFTTGEIAIRPDESWRTQMPAAQRRAVTALTLPLLAHYGYTRRAA